MLLLRDMEVFLRCSRERLERIQEEITVISKTNRVEKGEGRERNKVPCLLSG